MVEGYLNNSFECEDMNDDLDHLTELTAATLEAYIKGRGVAVGNTRSSPSTGAGGGSSSAVVGGAFPMRATTSPPMSFRGVSQTSGGTRTKTSSSGTGHGGSTVSTIHRTMSAVENSNNNHGAVGSSSSRPLMHNAGMTTTMEGEGGGGSGTRSRSLPVVSTPHHNTTYTSHSRGSSATPNSNMLSGFSLSNFNQHHHLAPPPPPPAPGHTITSINNKNSSAFSHANTRVYVMDVSEKDLLMNTQQGREESAMHGSGGGGGGDNRFFFFWRSDGDMALQERQRWAELLQESWMHQRWHLGLWDPGTMHCGALYRAQDVASQVEVELKKTVYLMPLINIHPTLLMGEEDEKFPLPSDLGEMSSMEELEEGGTAAAAATGGTASNAVPPAAAAAPMYMWQSLPSMPGNEELVLEHLSKKLQEQYGEFVKRQLECVSVFNVPPGEVLHTARQVRKQSGNHRVVCHYLSRGFLTRHHRLTFVDTNGHPHELSIRKLATELGFPLIFVADCAEADVLLDSFLESLRDREERLKGGVRYGQAMKKGGGGVGNANSMDTFSRKGKGGGGGAPLSSQVKDAKPGRLNLFAMSEASSPFIYSGVENESGGGGGASVNEWDFFFFGATGKSGRLAQHPRLPSDILTSCLTTPLQMSLLWYMVERPDLRELHPILLHVFPGSLSDKKTPLGQLHHYFQCITESIAWSTYPTPLYSRLYLQDCYLRPLCQGYLLAERIIVKGLGGSLTVFPPVPCTYTHPYWSVWDNALERSFVLIIKSVKPPPPSRLTTLEFREWLDSRLAHWKYLHTTSPINNNMYQDLQHQRLHHHHHGGEGAGENAAASVGGGGGGVVPPPAGGGGGGVGGAAGGVGDAVGGGVNYFSTETKEKVSFESLRVTERSSVVFSDFLSEELESVAAMVECVTTQAINVPQLYARFMRVSSQRTSKVRQRKGGRQLKKKSKSTKKSKGGDERVFLDDEDDDDAMFLSSQKRKGGGSSKAWLMHLDTNGEDELRGRRGGGGGAAASSEGKQKAKHRGRRKMEEENIMKKKHNIDSSFFSKRTSGVVHASRSCTHRKILLLKAKEKDWSIHTRPLPETMRWNYRLSPSGGLMFERSMTFWVDRLPTLVQCLLLAQYRERALQLLCRLVDVGKDVVVQFAEANVFTVLLKIWSRADCHHLLPALLFITTKSCYIDPALLGKDKKTKKTVIEKCLQIIDSPLELSSPRKSSSLSPLGGGGGTTSLGSTMTSVLPPALGGSWQMETLGPFALATGQRVMAAGLVALAALHDEDVRNECLQDRGFFIITKTLHSLSKENAKLWWTRKHPSCEHTGGGNINNNNNACAAGSSSPSPAAAAAKSHRHEDKEWGRYPPPPRWHLPGPGLGPGEQNEESNKFIHWPQTNHSINNIQFLSLIALFLSFLHEWRQEHGAPVVSGGGGGLEQGSTAENDPQSGSRRRGSREESSPQGGSNATPPWGSSHQQTHHSLFEEAFQLGLEALKNLLEGVSPVLRGGAMRALSILVSQPLLSEKMRRSAGQILLEGCVYRNTIHRSEICVSLQQESLHGARCLLEFLIEQLRDEMEVEDLSKYIQAWVIQFGAQDAKWRQIPPPQLEMLNDTEAEEEEDDEEEEDMEEDDEEEGEERASRKKTTQSDSPSRKKTRRAHVGRRSASRRQGNEHPLGAGSSLATAAAMVASGGVFTDSLSFHNRPSAFSSSSRYRGRRSGVYPPLFSPSSGLWPHSSNRGVSGGGGGGMRNPHNLFRQTLEAGGKKLSTTSLDGLLGGDNNNNNSSSFPVNGRIMYLPVVSNVVRLLLEQAHASSSTISFSARRILFDHLSHLGLWTELMREKKETEEEEEPVGGHPTRHRSTRVGGGGGRRPFPRPPSSPFRSPSLPMDEEEEGVGGGGGPQRSNYFTRRAGSSQSVQGGGGGGGPVIGTATTLMDMYPALLRIWDEYHAKVSRSKQRRTKVEGEKKHKSSRQRGRKTRGKKKKPETTRSGTRSSSSRSPSCSSSSSSNSSFFVLSPSSSFMLTSFKQWSKSGYLRGRKEKKNSLLSNQHHDDDDVRGGGRRRQMQTTTQQDTTTNHHHHHTPPLMKKNSSLLRHQHGEHQKVYPYSTSSYSSASPVTSYPLVQPHSRKTVGTMSDEEELLSRRESSILRQRERGGGAGHHGSVRGGGASLSPPSPSPSTTITSSPSSTSASSSSWLSSTSTTLLTFDEGSSVSFDSEFGKKGMGFTDGDRVSGRTDITHHHHNNDDDDGSQSSRDEEVWEVGNTIPAFVYGSLRFLSSIVLLEDDGYDPRTTFNRSKNTSMDCYLELLRDLLDHHAWSRRNGMLVRGDSWQSMRSPRQHSSSESSPISTSQGFGLMSSAGALYGGNSSHGSGGASPISGVANDYNKTSFATLTPPCEEGTRSNSRSGVSSMRATPSPSAGSGGGDRHLPIFSRRDTIAGVSETPPRNSNNSSRRIDVGNVTPPVSAEEGKDRYAYMQLHSTSSTASTSQTSNSHHGIQETGGGGDEKAKEQEGGVNRQEGDNSITVGDGGRECTTTGGSTSVGGEGAGMGIWRHPYQLLTTTLSEYHRRGGGMNEPSSSHRSLYDQEERVGGGKREEDRSVYTNLSYRHAHHQTKGGGGGAGGRWTAVSGAGVDGTSSSTQQGGQGSLSPLCFPSGVSIQALLFHPMEPQIVSCTSNGVVQVWEYELVLDASSGPPRMREVSSFPMCASAASTEEWSSGTNSENKHRHRTSPRVPWQGEGRKRIAKRHLRFSVAASTLNEVKEGGGGEGVGLRSCSSQASFSSSSSDDDDEGFQTGGGVGGCRTSSSGVATAPFASCSSFEVPSYFTAATASTNHNTNVISGLHLLDVTFRPLLCTVRANGAVSFFSDYASAAGSHRPLTTFDTLSFDERLGVGWPFSSTTTTAGGGGLMMMGREPPPPQRVAPAPFRCVSDYSPQQVLLYVSAPDQSVSVWDLRSQYLYVCGIGGGELTIGPSVIRAHPTQPSLIGVAGGDVVRAYDLRCRSCKYNHSSTGGGSRYYSGSGGGRGISPSTTSDGRSYHNTSSGICFQLPHSAGTGTQQLFGSSSILDGYPGLGGGAVALEFSRRCDHLVTAGFGGASAPLVIWDDRRSEMPLSVFSTIPAPHTAGLSPTESLLAPPAVRHMAIQPVQTSSRWIAALTSVGRGLHWMAGGPVAVVGGVRSSSAPHNSNCSRVPSPSPSFVSSGRAAAAAAGTPGEGSEDPFTAAPTSMWREEAPHEVTSMTFHPFLDLVAVGTCGTGPLYSSFSSGYSSAYRSNAASGGGLLLYGPPPKR